MKKKKVKFLNGICLLLNALQLLLFAFAIDWRRSAFTDWWPTFSNLALLSIGLGVTFWALFRDLSGAISIKANVIAVMGQMIIVLWEAAVFVSICSDMPADALALNYLPMTVMLLPLIQISLLSVRIGSRDAQ